MQIQLEDLFITCPDCQGAGHFAESVSTTSMAEQPENGGPECSRCGGVGGEITPSGQAIADFLNRLRSRLLV